MHIQHIISCITTPLLFPCFQGLGLVKLLGVLQFMAFFGAYIFFFIILPLFFLRELAGHPHETLERFQPPFPMSAHRIRLVCPDRTFVDTAEVYNLVVEVLGIIFSAPMFEHESGDRRVGLARASFEPRTVIFDYR